MKSLVRFAWLLPLFCLSSCVKENFEDVQIEVELPEPPVVYVVDCETMGLNVGDPCVVSSNNPAVDGLDGVVNDNCNCQPTAPPAGPVVTVAFWRQYGGAPLTVSTASDPPFLSGPDEVSISVGLTEVEFRFPPNTQSCSLQHSYLCAGNSVEWNHEAMGSSAGSDVEGAYAVVSVECFGILDGNPGVE
jgi:hypothetical protein